MRRHKKDLSIRTPDYIKLSRAKIGKAEVAEFFKNLQKTIDGVPPDNIINFDETGFVDDPGRAKVVVRRGSRRIENIMDTTKSNTSVMISGSASGLMLPPYIVFKSKELWSTWTEGGPPHARYCCSKSGWFEEALFSNWFSSVALPYFRQLKGNGRKVIIGDNVASHISLDVISKCRENDIDFILFPPNCTHLLQPLDVIFFRQLKPKWRKTLKNWKLKHSGPIPKDQFGKLLFSAMKELGLYPDTIPPQQKYFQSDYLKSSFKETGIFPFNPSKVLKRLPDVEDSNSNETESWTTALESFIREQRFSATKKKLHKEGRKSMWHLANLFPPIWIQALIQILLPKITLWKLMLITNLKPVLKIATPNLIKNQTIQITNLPVMINVISK